MKLIPSEAKNRDSIEASAFTPFSCNSRAATASSVRSFSLRLRASSQSRCGFSFERWYKAASRENPKLLYLSREELMRHEAAGITSSAFPKVLRVGGVDCATAFLHQPGDARDGVTVTVPIFALNQVSDETGENAIIVVPGAAGGLSPRDVEAARSLVDRAYATGLLDPSHGAR